MRHSCVRGRLTHTIGELLRFVHGTSKKFGSIILVAEVSVVELMRRIFEIGGSSPVIDHKLTNKNGLVTYILDIGESRPHNTITVPCQ